MVPAGQEEENVSLGEDLNLTKMKDSKGEAEKLLRIAGKLLQNRDLEGSNQILVIADIRLIAEKCKNNPHINSENSSPTPQPPIRSPIRLPYMVSTIKDPANEEPMWNSVGLKK